MEREKTIIGRGTDLVINDYDHLQIQHLINWLQSAKESKATHLRIYHECDIIIFEPIEMHLETDIEMQERIKDNVDSQIILDAILKKGRRAEYEKLKKEFESE